MQKQQISRIIAQSDKMTQQLTQLRNAIDNQTLNSSYSVSSEMLSNAIKHRTMLRILADTLEANRQFAQMDKQKIEKSRIVLEGLEYYKRTLKDKIQSYHTEAESIDQYFDQPIGQIDWINDYQTGEKKLKKSLQKIKQRDQEYKQKVNLKQQMIKQINEKNRLFNVILPKQAKKLNEQVLQAAKLFQLDTNQTLQKIQNSQLAYIYDSFKTLKAIEKVDVTYVKQHYQMLDVVLKPLGLDLYDRALQYNLKIQQKQLKMKIVYLKPEFNHLAIGIDRKSDLTSKDVFHKLINNQNIKAIFQDPANENQRNLNNKFIYLKWLEDALCNNSSKCAQFLNIVRERIFCTQLIKHIFSNLKTSNWLSFFSSNVFNQFTNKKFLVENIQINFNTYKQLITVPPNLAKSLNTYEQYLRRQARGELSGEAQQHMIRNRQKLIDNLNKIGLAQKILPQINSYYKITATYRSFKVQCVVIIPYVYPKIAPKIKILDLQNQQQSIQQALPQSLQCKAKIHTSNEQKEHLVRLIQQIENFSNNVPNYPHEGGAEFFKITKYLGNFFQAIIKAYNIYSNSKKGASLK